jgi:hypothetical protein
MFRLSRRVVSGLTGACVVIGSLSAAYASAVLVNTGRIAIALWLGADPQLFSQLTSAQLHRLEGIVVYFTGLVLLYELARRVDRTGVPALWCRS